jgi:hypothetical protein
MYISSINKNDLIWKKKLIKLSICEVCQRYLQSSSQSKILVVRASNPHTVYSRYITPDLIISYTE